MIKYILILILIHSYTFCFSQNLEFEKAYKFLIMDIYNDTTIQKTGELLAYPGEMKNNDKKNIIYIKPSSIYSKINRISYLEKNSKILFNIDTNIHNSIKKVNLTLFKNEIIDTIYNNSNNYKYNLLGDIFLNNIYVRRNYKVENFNEIFFEICIRGRNTRSYLLLLVHMIKINGEWRIKEQYDIERS